MSENTFTSKYADLVAEADKKLATPVRDPTTKSSGDAGLIESVFSGAAQGVTQAIDETFDASSQIGSAIGGGIKSLLPDNAERAVQRTLAPAANAFRRWGWVEDDGGTGLVQTSAGLATVGVKTPDNFAGQMSDDIAQFVTGFVGAGRVLKFAAPTTKVGAVGQGAVKGLAADFTAMDPHEERLSNLARDYNVIGGPIADFLAADGDDDALQGRLAQSLEGLGLGILAEGLFFAARGIKNARNGNTEAAVDDAAAADKAFKEAANPTQPDDLADDIAEDAGSKDFDGPELTRELEADDAPLAIAKETTEDAAGDAADEAATIPADTELPIEVTGREADDFIERTIENMKATDKGVEFREGYDPLTDINLDRLSSERGVREVAEAMGKALGDKFAEVRGGTRTFDDVAESAETMARDFATNRNSLAANIARVTGEGSNIPDTIDAMRILAESSRKRVLRAAQGYASNKSTENLTTLFQDIQVLANIQATVKGYSSNLGRGLGQLRRVVSESDDVSKALASIDDPQVMASLDPTGNSSTVQDALDTMLDRLSKTGGNPRRMAKVLEPTLFQKFERVAETYYTASIMSSLGTHGVNLLGGLQQNFLIPLERATAGILAKDRSLYQEGVDQMYYTWSSVFDSMRIAGRAWKQGSGILESAPTSSLTADAPRGAIDAASLGVASDTVLGKFLNATNYLSGHVFRMITFGDEMNRQMAYVGRTRASLARAGRESGLEGARLSKFIDDGMEQYVDRNGAAVRESNGEFAFQEGIDNARQTVFQEGFERGGPMYNLERTVRGIPGSRIFLAPFIRTPTNIIRAAVRRTPVLQNALKEVRADLSGVNGKEAQALARAQATVGGGIYTMFAGLAMAGMVTGAGPKRERMRWEAEKMAGWLPFSIKGPDGKFYSTTRQDPLASHLMIAATAVEMMQMGDEEGAEGAMSIAYTSIMAGLKDKTYLQGVTDFMAVFDEGDTDTASVMFEKWLGSKAGGFIPSAISNANADIDPYQRAANDFFDGIEKRIPFASENVDVAYDILGRPLERAQGWPFNQLNMSRTSRDKDPVLDEMFRQYLTADKLKTALPKSYRGFKLTDIPSSKKGQSAHARWNELIGTTKIKGSTLYESVESLIASDQYKYVLTDGTEGVAGSRLEAIGKLITQYRKAARKALVLETPVLAEALQDLSNRTEATRQKGSDPLTELDGDPDKSSVEKFIRNYR